LLNPKITKTCVIHWKNKATRTPIVQLEHKNLTKGLRVVAYTCNPIYSVRMVSSAHTAQRKKKPYLKRTNGGGRGEWWYMSIIPPT
jgi:hypothetical protein